LLGTAALLLLLVAVTASVGYARTASALAGERTQRRRAEAATDVAIDVLDRIYERCAPPDFGSPRDATLWGADGDRAAKPALSEGTAAMLEDLLVFYDRLAESAGRDVQYREQVALANRRIGGIRHHLRQWEQAQAAYQRALETYQQIDQTSGVRPHVLEIALICNELGILDGHLGRPTGRASGSRKHWTCCRRPSATSTARRSRRSGPRWLVASGS
jgi:tetratricopeptide (TPR) repeat protein